MTRVSFSTVSLSALIVTMVAVGALCGCSSSDKLGAYAGLYDPDPHKVQQLTVLFSDAGDPGAIPHLIENLDHPDKFIRLQTHLALNKTTHNRVTIPYRFDMSTAALADSQAKWRELYEKEGASLATPPVEKPSKG